MYIFGYLHRHVEGRKVRALSLLLLAILLSACGATNTAEVNATGIWQGVISGPSEAPITLNITDVGGVLTGRGTVLGMDGDLQGQRNGSSASLQFQFDAGATDTLMGNFSGDVFSGEYQTHDAAVFPFRLTR